MIHINRLYDFLANKAFQDPLTGNLFFPAYIYTYDPRLEYAMQAEIAKLVAQLKRPNNFLDCMVLNLYEEMIEFLQANSFAGESLFDQIMEKEQEDIEEADEWFQEEVDGDAFIAFLSEKVNKHFPEAGQDDNTRVYLIIHGIGDAFPHMRASDLLKRTESLVKRFKLILFYPGTYVNNQYRLFGALSHDNMYRATRLNELIS